MSQPNQTQPPRLLVTGSRHHTWRDEDTAALIIAAADINRMRNQQAPGTPWCAPILVHGGARGADTSAAEAAHQLGWKTERHPADWARLGRAAGPARNRHMVSLGADLCLAFPDHHRGRGSYGTWNCVDIAYKAGIPVLIVWDQRLWVYDTDRPFPSATALGLPVESSRTLVKLT